MKSNEYTIEREWEASQMVKEKEYWLTKLSGELLKTGFPYDHSGEAEETPDPVRTITFKIAGELFERMMKVSNRSDVRLYVIMMSGLILLIRRYTGVDDIIIGAPIFKQDVKNELINRVLALRNRVEPGQTFKEFLIQVGQTLFEANENQNYPMESLLYNLNIEVNDNDDEASPLFDIAGMCENIHDRTYIDHIHTNMFFSFLNTGSMIDGVLEYNSHLYQKETVQRIINHLRNLLNEVLFNLDIPVSQVSVLSGEEKRQLLVDFNNNKMDFPRDKSLSHFIADHAQSGPHRIALSFEGHHLTYGSLNRRSRRLAGVLGNAGIGADRTVGLLMERSLLMVECILAVWKAGAAYIPIETDYPLKRILGIMNDSGTGVLLTNPADYPNPELEDSYNGKIITSPHTPGDAAPGESLTPGDLPVNMSSLAYVIYTSGSTGKPKGAMVEHIGMMNHMHAKVTDLRLTRQSIVAQNAAHTFDISVWQFFVALIVKGRTVIYPHQLILDPAAFITRLICRRGTVLEVVPSYLAVLLDSLEQGGTPSLPLEFLLVTGEEVKPHLVKQWFHCYPHIKMVNAYGPTEASDDITHYIMEQAPDRERIPIGKPLRNLNIYIVDEKMNPCPIGVKGEICVSGVGVGRGYLKDSKRTNEVFLEDPFLRQSGGEAVRLYKTGDLGSWLPDGNIDFFGRKDYQVKMRGFRIELGEIQSKLDVHPAVRESVVKDIEDPSGNKSLCAYLVMTSAGTLKAAQLKNHLSVHLPDYMVPSYFVELERLPLTPNGKVDRKALPQPMESSLAMVNSPEDRNYVGPGNEVEETLTRIWAGVLGNEAAAISIDDNFFEIGGHSLVGITLISVINKKLHVEVPLTQLFMTATIRGLAKHINNSARQVGKSTFVSIGAVEKKEYYVMSSAQKRLYFLHQMDEGRLSYNIPSIFELEGDLDLRQVKQVLDQLIKRHESLRTSFKFIHERPFQFIADEPDFDIEYHHMVNDDSGAEYSVIKSFIAPFDLVRAPLLKLGFIRLEERKHILMFDTHHIVSDGVSAGIFMNEFMALYEGKTLEPLKIQYKDYSQWQVDEREREKFKQQESYWLEQFREEIHDLQLPSDYTRPAILGFEGGSVSFTLPPGETRRLNALAIREGVTLYMVLIAVYYIMLYRLSSQEDIVIGTPTAGRIHADLQNIIGVFLNTLPLRNYPDGNKTFNAFLREVRTNVLGAFDNQEYQFEDMVDKLNVNIDTSRNPVFDAMFVLHTQEIPGVRIEGLKLKPFDFNVETSNFDLTLIGVETREEIDLTAVFSTNLFKKETMETFTRYFRKIVTAIVNEPRIKLSQIEIISEDQRNYLLYELNDTQTEYPEDKTIHRFIEEQAAKIPDRAALIFGDRQLTYRQLNREADRLSAVLRWQGAAVGDIIGILFDRSMEMIIGILAVLKAGGAYVPLDPQYPTQRINYILADSNAKTLLSTTALSKDVEAISRWSGRTVFIDSDHGTGEPQGSPRGTTEPGGHYTVLPGDMAYIIYTSGSTGTPRGVMIEHSSVINLIVCQMRHFQITPEERVLQFSSISFDASVEQIFIAFFSGAGLVLVSKEDLLDGESFESVVSRYGITHMDTVPSFLKTLKMSSHYQLKRVICGGDICPVSLARDWSDARDFYNVYGPTETTVTSIKILVKNPDDGLKTLPVGKPLDNTRVYLLDRNEVLVPVGVVGELCIGGSGVGRGYLNRVDMTAERFKPDCFSTRGRFYRTGDLARRLPDGNIEFLGRIDHQVKVRGYRVELGEIENRVLQHNGIKEAVVLAHGDDGGDNYLCAYVIPVQGGVAPISGDITPAAADVVSPASSVSKDLREYLSALLPGYMVPSYFVELEEIPLTTGGKVDRGALTAPRLKAAADYIAPRNHVEIQLAALWAEVLEIDRSVIGLDSNFFELGGHSLRATVMIAKIHKALNVKIPLTEVFRTSNIRGLAQYIHSAAPDRYAAMEPSEKREYYVLSSAQKRLYILNRMELESTVYNMPQFIPLEEAAPVEVLEECFRKLIRRHESLRTSFHLVDNQPVQKVHDHVEFRMEVGVENLENSKPNDGPAAGNKKQIADSKVSREGNAVLYALGSELYASFVRPFDLSHMPLLRVGLAETGQGKHILMVDMHHIISDGMSLDLLKTEFIALYEGKTFPPLPIQYRDFSQWQNRLDYLGEALPQESFWLDRFKDQVPLINLPTDYPRPSFKSFAGDRLGFRLGTAESTGLLEMAREEGTTLYIVLLAIYNVFLSRLSRQEDIVVGTAVAGRRHADLENIVGMFVNTLALRNYPKGTQSFTKFLRDVNTRTLDAFENQDYQFDQLVDKVVNTRETTRNPLFDVSFAFQDHRTHPRGLQEADTPADSDESPVDDLEVVDTAKFDLTLSVMVDNTGMLFGMIYNTRLFRENTIALMATWFRQILQQAIASPDQGLNHFQLGSGTEKEFYDYLEISESQVECIYPVVPTQRDIYLDCKLNPLARAHRVVYYYSMSAIDVDPWEQALGHVHRFYPILRSGLTEREDQVYLAVNRKEKPGFEYIDLTGESWDTANIHKKIAEMMAHTTHNPDQGMLKHYLLKLADNSFINIISIHHIIIGGLSFKLLFEKWHYYYEKIRNAHGMAEPETPLDHQVFIRHQQTMQCMFDTPAVENYWKERFSRVNKLQARPRHNVSHRMLSEELMIDESHLEEIQKYCHRFMISPPFYFRALYALLIQFYFNVEEDFLIRELFSSRDESMRDYVSCFFHTVPLVFDRKLFAKDRKIRRYFQDVFGNLLEIRDKQYVSILLQNRLLGEEDMVFYYNYRDFLNLETPAGQYNLKRLSDYNEADYHRKDVQFIAKKSGDEFFLELGYDEKYIDGKKFLQRLLHVSRQVVEHAVSLDDIQFITQEEKQEVLDFASGGTADFPSATPLCRLFSQQAERFPHRLALQLENRQFTYSCLNETSDWLADHLRAGYGIGPDRLTGVLMTRTEQMVLGILGTWKAGGAYIPLDPKYPIGRILQLLEDSGATTLLSRSRYITPRLEEDWKGRIFRWDRHEKRSDHRYAGTAVAPPENIDMQSLAYVIYTSGSTGKPKGAMVEHIGMMNHIQAKIDDLRLNAQSVVAQNASHTFDISIWQFFVSLVAGGKTVIYPDSFIFEPLGFLNRLSKDRVTILEVVPSYLSVMLEISREPDTPIPLPLTHLLVTGETVKPNLVRQWFELYPRIPMVNAYGPTEASDDITHHIMKEAPDLERVPIGKPLPNLNIYIVDEHMNLCPVGIKGEICVSGVGVGRGYLKDEATTRESFMEDPFSPRKGIRFYKTGDLGCWLPDGNIDFFGRKDYQVKIRGFRIELGEIESNLTRHPLVKEAVVIDRETIQPGGKTVKYLCAYFVSGEDLTHNDLKAHLALELPDYMIPNSFIKIDQIPLTPNGKIDRKAMPAPDEILLESDVDYKAPGDEAEQKLVEIWEQVLGRSPIGINENFFFLGGDSIKSIQIAARMNKAGYKLQMRQIFEYPIISELALKVTKREQVTDQSPVTGNIPLTPIQVEFFKRAVIHPHHFNFAAMFYSKDGFDEEALGVVFTKIQEHHDALRMCYRMEEGRMVQINMGPDYPISLQVHDLRNQGDPAAAKKVLEIKANEIQTSIDLQNGPLLKPGLFRMNDGDRLLIIVHHLVVDGISWRILFEDIEALLQQYKEGKTLELPLKTDSFKRWSEKLTQYADSPSFLKERDYWEALESTGLPGVKKDFDGQNDKMKEERLSFTLEESETELLLTKVNEAFGTEINDILLTALGLSIRGVYGNRKVLVALEGHGREDIIKDIDINRTVGWFTCWYPVILDMSHETDLSRQIKEVKENFRSVPHKGVGYGILKFLTAPGNKKNMSFRLEPQIIFNYLGQMDSTLEELSFEAAQESLGETESPKERRKYELDISGMVVNHRLVVDIVFNENQFKRNTIETLRDQYKENLREIIRHCTSRDEAQLTPSDFVYKDLSIEELGALDVLFDN
ncbi:MAG: amino acid adenylation domain-containing protein [bacterium]|nr:amino acid adenylation domain-containing protein [bacterium]